MKILKLMIYLSVVALFSTACNKDEITTSSKAEESAALANPIEQNYLSLLHQLEQEDVTSKASNPLESRSSYSAGSTVYIMSNEINENQVIAFSRGSDGKLNELARYATGGNGNGAGLGSQGAVAIDDWGRILLTVNPGSNDISAFFVRNDGSLRYVDRIASGGTTPISISSSRGRVFVVNAGGTGNIAGFTFNGTGHLSPLPNSIKSLSTDASGPAQISFSPNGTVLVITEKATNSISSFSVDNHGNTGNIHTIPSAGATPFGFYFTSPKTFLVSEAAGGAAGASTISSYRINPIGTVTLIEGPFATHGSAACWVVADNNGKTVYATNTGSNDITSLSVSGYGHLSLANGGASTPTNAGPIDAAMDKNSRNLYVLARGNSAIISYSVKSNGRLTQIDEDGGLPARASGLVVR